MVIDTSAAIAILLNEPGADHLSDAILSAPVRLVSAATVVEISIVALARAGVKALDRWRAMQRELDIEVVDFTEQQSHLAALAFDRYGKGRHRAALNLGDCYSYAVARDLGEPLLFKGTDFSVTDIDVVALPGASGLHEDQ